MQQIVVDDRTYELARALAARQQETLQAVVSSALSDAARKAGLDHPPSVIGALSHEADFLDQIVEEAMLERETRALRLANGA